MNSNKILPFTAIIVLIMFIFVGIKSCRKETTDYVGLSAVPEPETLDLDSSADTIRSLTAEVDAVKKQSIKLSKQNDELLKQSNQIQAKVSSNLRREMAAKPPPSGVEDVMDEMSKQLSYFNARINEMSAAQEKSQETEGVQDIPIGFGIDASDMADKDSLDETIIWIEPLGTQVDSQGNPSYSDSGSVLHANSPNTLDVDNYLQHSNINEIVKTEELYYTVPRNSTLIGSVSMTALIGRIPLNSIVQEPFPFKVIVGKENLATNGIDMPFLDGMIFSGTATGDWALSCVRGSVHSVTFTFSDGRIRTLSSDDGSLQSINQKNGKNNSQGGDRPLGWISDRRGIPCIAGQRISNAIDYLSGRIFAAGASAAAEAFAQGEVTNSVSPIGGVATSVITGDAAKFAGFNALSGGVNEVGEYIKERAAQSFDVIYVDTGAELAIHVDVELPIDYELNGRKTNYAYQNQDTYSRYLD